MVKDSKREEIKAFMRGHGIVEVPNIPIHLWIEQGEQWLEVCREMVRWYRMETGETDTDSVFALSLRNAQGKKNEGE